MHAFVTDFILNCIYVPHEHPGCSRGLELKPKARDDARLKIKSSGYHIWRVFIRQSSVALSRSAAVCLVMMVYVRHKPAELAHSFYSVFVSVSVFMAL